MGRFDFAFFVTQVENGDFVVTCRDLPQLHIKGKDRKEALANAQIEMDIVFMGHMQAFFDLPTPSATTLFGECLISVPAVTAAKARMYEFSRVALAEKIAKFDPKTHSGEYLAFPRVGREIWE